MTDPGELPTPRSSLIALGLALFSGLLVLVTHPPGWSTVDVVCAALIAAGLLGMLRVVLAPAVPHTFGLDALPEGVRVTCAAAGEPVAGYRTTERARSGPLTITLRSARHRLAMNVCVAAATPAALWLGLATLVRRPEDASTVALGLSAAVTAGCCAFLASGLWSKRLTVDPDRRVVDAGYLGVTLLPPGAVLVVRRLLERNGVRDELLVEHHGIVRPILRHDLADPAQLIAIAHVIAGTVGSLRVEDAGDV